MYVGPPIGFDVSGLAPVIPPLTVNGLGWEAMENVIRNRFDEQVTDLISTTLPVHYDNVDFEIPNDGSRWCRFSILEGDSQQVAMGGSKRVRTPGVITIEIFIPINEGNQEALNVADFVAAAFRLISSGGVIYQTPSINKQGRQGEKWKVIVRCPFYADIVVS